MTQKSFLRCPEGCIPLHEAFFPGSLEKPGNFVPLCQVRHRPGTLLRQERRVRVQQQQGGGPVVEGSAEEVRVHLPELESPAERVGGESVVSVYVTVFLKEQNRTTFRGGVVS